MLNGDPWPPVPRLPVHVHWPPPRAEEQHWTPPPVNAQTLSQYALALSRRASRLRAEALHVAALAEAAAAALHRAEAVTAVQGLQQLNLAHCRLREATGNMAGTAVVITVGLESTATVNEWRRAVRQPAWVRCMAAIRRAWHAVNYNVQPLDATVRRGPLPPRAG